MIQNPTWPLKYSGDNSEVLARLGKHALESGIGKLVGKRAYIQPAIENLHSRVRISVLHLGFLETHPEQLATHYDYPVRAATKDDIPLLVQLYRHYEFYNKNRPEEEIEHEIRKTMDESGIYFFIEWEGQAVSAGRVAPEIDRAGMIDAATTLPEFRGRGMYPCVRTACYGFLFKKGKIGVALVNDANATIHRIADKYGGSFTAKWLLVEFRRKPPLRRRIIPLRLRRWGLSIRDRVLRRWLRPLCGKSE